jgi:hypothetical protein
MVRFGSLADIANALPNVRFSPESGHHRTPSSCLLSARSDRFALQKSSLTFAVMAGLVQPVDGQPDLYPFVLSPKVVEKLGYVMGLMRERA